MMEQAKKIPQRSEIAPEQKVYPDGHTVWCHLNNDAE